MSYRRPVFESDLLELVADAVDCLNGGTYDYVFSWCDCTEGFIGDRCETGIKTILDRKQSMLRCSKYWLVDRISRKHNYAMFLILQSPIATETTTTPESTTQGI